MRAPEGLRAPTGRSQLPSRRRRLPEMPLSRHQAMLVREEPAQEPTLLASGAAVWRDLRQKAEVWLVARKSSAVAILARTSAIRLMLVTRANPHNKQEAKCLATKDGEGSLKKTLKCDDECARLERNRKLALALNVDSEAHKDDHIPYSAETLSLYQQNVQWAQTQEREFRVFATSTEEKRLRFKPMSSQQRAFVHALAEDFGLDSESMDPEPHRHVVVYKTPRFVSAPTKTVGECVRIRYNQRVATTVTAPATATDAAKRLKASNVVGDPYNGFLLSTPRFALTIEELRTAIRPVIDSAPMVQLDISFLPSDEVVLKANATLSERDLEAVLKNIKAGLAREVRSHSLGSIQLCRVDASLNILRRETDSAANGGWSQVAAKAAAPARMRPQQSARVGSNSFTVLSLSNKSKESRDKEKSKKKAVEEAVDDWEAAETMEEEKEKLESGDASKVASGAVTEDEAETTKTEADNGAGVGVSDAGEQAAGLEGENEAKNYGDVPV
ncbi:nf-x1 type zinc finger [Diplodia corticola]|uniref:Nf-x1 type zinc finger n=1 Tax=Diplodia corticola TaxID=236234 RepID=A0A1J9RVF1_9PEZI|nr:nf-x1 type zinc finger [Diplodia corticola]OJD32367.1 nf-x1 type zinc finger [Diplodia corticola]